jgi:hypothetical protein
MEEQSLVTDVAVTMDSARELLQVEVQVLGVLPDPGDGAGGNALMGMRVVSVRATRGVGRRAVIAASGTDLTRMALFDVDKVESFSMVCW